MKFDLRPDGKEKAKHSIRKLKKIKRGWEQELEKAKEFLKSCPNKFYKNTKNRIAYADKQIADIDIKISKFKEAIKKGYVEI